MQVTVGGLQVVGRECGPRSRFIFIAARGDIDWGAVESEADAAQGAEAGAAQDRRECVFLRRLPVCAMEGAGGSATVLYVESPNFTTDECHAGPSRPA